MVEIAHETKLRSKEEVAILWRQYKSTRDPSIREKLILQYTPLVKYVLGRLAVTLPDIIDSEDIMSYGLIGLITAVERFDPDKGVKFETYGISRIRGNIIDELRAIDWIPRSARERVREITRSMARLEAELERSPTDAEVADDIGMDLHRYRDTLARTSVTTFSLDRPIDLGGSEDRISVGDVIADESSPDPGREIEMRELEDELTLAIEDLPDRERLLLSLYYHEDLTMKEISQVLEISESRVCQIHARAVLKLRGKLAERGHSGPPS